MTFIFDATGSRNTTDFAGTKCMDIIFARGTEFGGSRDEGVGWSIIFVGGAENCSCSVYIIGI